MSNLHANHEEKYWQCFYLLSMRKLNAVNDDVAEMKETMKRKAD